MSATHTRRSWRVVPVSFGERVHIRDDCANKHVAYWVDPEDAPLIQAAPELLAALEQIASVLGQPIHRGGGDASFTLRCDSAICLGTARAAIAKARGQA